jgi:HSP20 family protein
MSQVAIEKVYEEKVGTASIFQETENLYDRIRKRAFAIFEGRNGGDGFATEDWLKAERDLLFSCESELVEQDGKFEVKMNAPGFEPNDVKVTALPDALIVSASSSHTHEKDKGDVSFCEFGQKSLFRRFDLPEQIDPDNVTAELNKGVLHLTAPKAKELAAAETKAMAA